MTCRALARLRSPFRVGARGHFPGGGVTLANEGGMSEAVLWMCNVPLRASGGSVGLPDAVSWGKVLGVWELRGDFCYICAGADVGVGTRRRPNPGGYREMGEQQALCAG